jgi:hypothetical protein
MSEEKLIQKFNQWLHKVYEVNSPPIPQYVLEIVRTQIHKRYGMIHIPDMTETKIGRLLRDIEFTDFYGREKEILDSLEYKAIPEITTKSKEKMRQLLIAMQPTYNKHCKTNSISFNYIMYKICQMFEQKDLLPFLKLNLTHEKLYNYDRIWHLICDDMKWYFIKSDPIICSLTPQTTPLLLGLNGPPIDRDLENWLPEEVIRLLKGVEQGLTNEQLALGHNRSVKNIESQLKQLIIEKHEAKTHSVEELIRLTGLVEEVVVDTIMRHETRRNRSIKKKDPKTIENTIVPDSATNANNAETMKELLIVLKDIQGMMRYVVSKI